MYRQTINLLCLAGMLVLFVGSSGCSVFQGARDYLMYNDTTNDFVLGYRNQVWARQSWHTNKFRFADHPFLKDVERGYLAGYRDVASGGSGCPPAVPPRCYWSWGYQTPEGQAKVDAWFSAYPEGAAAAEQENAGDWLHIQVSSQIQTQYSEKFQNGTIFLPDVAPGESPMMAPLEDDSGATDAFLEQVPRPSPQPMPAADDTSGTPTSYVPSVRNPYSEIPASYMTPAGNQHSGMDTAVSATIFDNRRR